LARHELALERGARIPNLSKDLQFSLEIIAKYLLKKQPIRG